MDQPNYDPSEPVGIKLARLETKVDALLSSRVDHEKRLRNVEQKLWTFAGAASVAGAVLSFVASKFTLNA